uniref:Uncharacterized protein n=1 Tax=Timema monikensis TaxID=170555 RepID=A0A7R9EEB8_9NEOP|nr:unnamed protein product [Timema monikensis]
MFSKSPGTKSTRPVLPPEGGIRPPSPDIRCSNSVGSVARSKQTLRPAQWHHLASITWIEGTRYRRLTTTSVSRVRCLKDATARRDTVTVLNQDCEEAPTVSVIYLFLLAWKDTWVSCEATPRLSCSRPPSHKIRFRLALDRYQASSHKDLWNVRSKFESQLGYPIGKREEKVYVKRKCIRIYRQGKCKTILEQTLSRLDRDSNLALSVIDTLVYCDFDASDHVVIEYEFKLRYPKETDLDTINVTEPRTDFLAPLSKNLWYRQPDRHREGIAKTTFSDSGDHGTSTFIKYFLYIYGSKKIMSLKCIRGLLYERGQVLLDAKCPSEFCQFWTPTALTLHHPSYISIAHGSFEKV